LEDQSLLTTVWVGELDLTIQSTRTEQGRIQRISSISSHDHFHVRVLIETIHLVQQL
jgi:hypothetical protein